MGRQEVDLSGAVEAETPEAPCWRLRFTVSGSRWSRELRLVPGARTGRVFLVKQNALQHGGSFRNVVVPAWVLAGLPQAGSADCCVCLVGQLCPVSL